MAFLTLVATWFVQDRREGVHPETATQQVRESQGSVRIAAIGDLERFGPEDPGVALTALVASLGDPDAEIRAAAASALVLVFRSAVMRGTHRPESLAAVSRLFALRDDPEVQVRATAVRVIWMVASLAEGPASVVALGRADDALVTAASDREESVRLAAIRGLGMIAPKVAAAPPPVLSRCLEDPSGEVRLASAEALVRFRDGLPRELPALIRSFEEAGPGARSGYSALIDRIRPRSAGPGIIPALASALAVDDPEVRRLVANSLASLGDATRAAIPDLIASVARTAPESGDDRDPGLAAADALQKITPESWMTSKSRPTLDPASFRTMASILRSGSPKIRAASARVLGRCQPNPDFVPALEGLVRNPDPNIRTAALDALHDVGSSMPFEPPESVAAALEDGSPEVRCAAAHALGHAGRAIDPSLAALLRHAEHDPDPEVRISCASEIQRSIRPPAVTPVVVPALVEALGSPDRRVRSAASGLLFRLGASSAPAIPALIVALERAGEPRGDLVGWIVERDMAAIALGEAAAGTPQAGPAVAALIGAIRGEPTMGMMQALARFGPLASPAIPRLRELERGKNQGIRDAARKALSAIEPVI